MPGLNIRPSSYVGPARPVPSRRVLLTGALAGALTASSLFAGTASAASDDNWPSRSIRWLVPYAAGTAPDTTVRVVAEALSAILKQPVVVENKAGAGGNLGAQIAAQAKPDGYTWVYSASPMAANMRMHRSPGFDVMKDFRHVSRIATSDLIVVVPASSKINSLNDLIAELRKRPDQLTYGSGGIGTPAHLGVEMFLNAISAKAVHVPYKGAADVVNALVSGQIDFAFPVTSVAVPMLEQKRLKAFAVTGTERNPAVPAVPILRDAGVNVSLTSFGGISVPAGTPEPIVSRLNQAVREALGRQSVRDTLVARGANSVAASSPEEFSNDFVREMAQTSKMMSLARLEAQ